MIKYNYYTFYTIPLKNLDHLKWLTHSKTIRKTKTMSEGWTEKLLFYCIRGTHVIFYSPLAILWLCNLRSIYHHGLPFFWPYNPYGIGIRILEVVFWNVLGYLKVCGLRACRLTHGWLVYHFLCTNGWKNSVRRPNLVEYKQWHRLSAILSLGKRGDIYIGAFEEFK